MKKLLTLCLLLFGFHTYAQHDPNDLIMSQNWDIIGGVDIKTVQNNQTVAKFSPEIKKFANKSFELEGYLVPIKDGMKQTKFMLSTLPINQCFYCGQNGIPIMVLVELTAPVKFTYQPITVRGTLKLHEGNAMDQPPVALVNAKAI